MTCSATSSSVGPRGRCDVGFYEGGYYSRCLQVFDSICPSGHVDPGDEKGKSIQNSLCYSAVIGSHYRLGDFKSATDAYEVCRKLGLFPAFPESMMIASGYELSELYRAQLETWLEEKRTIPGVPESELFGRRERDT